MSHVPVLLFAYANDRADDRYLRKLPEERRRIKEALRTAIEAKRCEAVVCPDATLDEVLKECQDKQTRLAVFHFAGHADGKSLLFEKTREGTGRAEATTLATFLGSLRGLKLVFLNGCATGDQVSALLAAGVPIVIATSTSVRDDVAADFASHFYGALGSGATVGDSYQQATNAVRLTFGAGMNERDAVAAVLRDAVPPSSPSEAEWPWRLHGDDIASRERLVVAAHSRLFASAAWATVIAAIFFFGVELYYKLYKPRAALGDPLTPREVGILAIALWILVNSVLLLWRLLQSRRALGGR